MSEQQRVIENSLLETRFELLKYVFESPDPAQRRLAWMLASRYHGNERLFNFKIGEFKYEWKLSYTLEPIARHGSKKAYLQYVMIHVDEIPKTGVTIIAEVTVEDQIVLKGVFDDESPPIKFSENNLNLEVEPDSAIKILIKVQRQVDPEAPQNKFAMENYQKLLVGNQDVTLAFEGGEKQLFAHSKILSLRSPVFAAMFETDMIEKKKGLVEITDIECAVFQLLLSFVNFGQLSASELNVDTLLKLIVAADKYEIEELVKLCEQLLIERIKVDNVVRVVDVADRINAENLKLKCMEFIYENSRQVHATDDYKAMAKTRKSLGVAILDFFCEKKDS